MADVDLGLPMNGNSLQQLPPNATKEQQTAVINDILNRLNGMLRSQTFSDATSKRFIMGYAAGRWPGGDFGMAISDEGDDVLSVDFNRLIFAWDFSTNKQYIRGGTQIYYDGPGTVDDIGQVGILPDGEGGSAWAKEGESVDDAFNS